MSPLVERTATGGVVARGNKQGRRMNENEDFDLGLAEIIEKLSALADEAKSLCERPIEPIDLADIAE